MSAMSPTMPSAPSAPFRCVRAATTAWTTASAAATACPRRAPASSRRRILRRQRPVLVRQHPGSDELHVRGHGGRLFRRLRSRGRGRNRPCRQPSHRPRQETVDVGQPGIRLRLGPQSDRSRREGRLSALHRADGRRLHRQPARLLLPRARRDQDIQPVLVSDPRHRPGRAGNLAAALHLAGRRRRRSASHAVRRRCRRNIIVAAAAAMLRRVDAIAPPGGRSSPRRALPAGVASADLLPLRPRRDGGRA